jgi:ribosome-associated heat shock protein Hsp15
MPENNDLRIDKFLWAARVFKTRTIAAEACTKGHVIINNVSVKPSRTVKVGEVIYVRKPPMIHSYKIIKLLNNRLSAQLVKDYIEELTPDEEFLRVEMIRLQRNAVRDRGTGRPTKRDRRDIDKFTGDIEE